MAQVAVRCGCGRSMHLDGRVGRNAFRCGCGARVQVIEQPDTARRCTFGECRTLASTKEPLRFCPEHQEKAAVLLAHTAGAAKVRELEEGLGLSPASWNRKYGYGVTPVPTNTHHAPLIYFARRDALIKIGWTSQIHKRMRALQGQVLATEPGDIVRERQLHRRFTHLLARGREWFHPEPDLISYINDLREASGSPPITGAVQPVAERVELTAYLAETTENPITRTLTRDGELLGGYPTRQKWARPDRPPRVHAAVTGSGAGTAVAACTRSQEVGHGEESLIPASKVPAAARCTRAACRARWAALPG
ncbi:GIY-YIG nuclease family protein [Streptomyces sp. LBUM 1486]|uniref:GIY-YIG nuclease family protein n=1 Tax=Streptomyces scabiei TaxID=1930 RepID=UPI001B33946D|nr:MULTISPECIES: GIY-YIG nuclease family protein [Streptomyces]MBP5918696.1 GIY-YIG nuclease family protein [Streptomyces sp. LBUM 1486]MDX2800179.1 GIY-YIG nuclease family protein [Streptomyces scabiei]MDX3127640.1 GIY-YIG nuclease family protein [Streptomyces scabiei]